MIAALIALTILALCGVIFLACEFRRVTGLYDHIYSIMESDRDALKQEVETLRLAIFPQLNRSEVNKVARPTAAIPAPTEYNRLIPWRRLNKILQRQHNTQQAGRDKTAAAIQENQNAKSR